MTYEMKPFSRLFKIQKFSFLFVILMLCSAVKAQTLQPNLKFGKPSDEELNLKEYAPDKEADAVVLYSSTDVWYTFSSYIQQVKDIKVRLKILKSEGKRFANQSIVYVRHSSSTGEEKIQGLKAFAYNMEGGKMIKTKMESNMINDEKIDDYHYIEKFTIPQVKVGTVIEYSYSIYSDFITSIDPWYAQQDIPVVYSLYSLSIPEWFKFHFQETGFEHTNHKTESINVNWTIGNCPGEKNIWEATNMPAVKDDDYIFCSRDYLTKVCVELYGLQIPGEIYKNYTSTWEDVADQLNDYENFGGLLKKSDPMKDVLASSGADKVSDIKQKVSLIYQAMKKHLRWNGHYGLLGYGAHKVMKEGTGNNADLNFILISMLKDAGLKAYPVVMSRRKAGRLPLHPSLDGLNTFIVGVAENDSTLLYIDSSVEDGCVDILPPDLMPDRARVIFSPKSGAWVNLQNLSGTRKNSLVSVEVDADGNMKGTMISNMMGNAASDLRHSFRIAKDSTTFVNNLAAEKGIEITNYKIEGRQAFSPKAKEVYSFTKKCNVSADHLYINPVVISLLDESPFKAQTRVLPVEFPYKEMINQSVSITIPKGYVVEEKPKGVKMFTQDGALRFIFTCGEQDGKLLFNYRLNVNKTLFVSTEYEYLRKIFEAIVQRNDDMVVLKKAAQ